MSIDKFSGDRFVRLVCLIQAIDNQKFKYRMVKKMNQ